MTSHRANPGAVAAALVLLGACALAVAAPPPPPPSTAGRTAAAASAQSADQRVDYAALEQHVGDEIVIESTLNTVRRGTLIKYTTPALTLQLGPENGSIELSVPRETVRSIRVTKPAQTPTTAQEQGDPSAQKN